MTSKILAGICGIALAMAAVCFSGCRGAGVESWIAPLPNPVSKMQLVMNRNGNAVRCVLQTLSVPKSGDVKITEIHGTIRLVLADSTVTDVPLVTLTPGDSAFKPVRNGNDPGSNRVLEYGFPQQDFSLGQRLLLSAYCDFKTFLVINGETIVCYSKSEMTKHK